jgi:signal transduction histidine kinase
MKINLFVIFLLAINLLSTAQNQQTDKLEDYSIPFITQARLDSLKSIFLSEDLKYHSGDDPLWAKKDFDDTDWTDLYVNFQIAELVKTDWEGIGWFRKKFKIDASLPNQAIAFTMMQNGASEFYLNGKLIKSFGTIKSDSTKEELFNPQATPFIVVLDTSAIQVVAIRLSNQNLQKLAVRYPIIAENDIFSFWVKAPEYSIESKVSSEQYTAEYIFILAFFLAFTILHLLLFFFYSKGKENLYFALFTGSVAFLEVANILFYTSHSGSEGVMLIISLGTLFGTLAMLGYVFFLYAIFYEKMPRQFWLLVGLGVLIGVFFMSPFASRKFFYYVLFPFVLLLTVEGLRVIILAIRRKKRNSLIIGSGVIIFFFSFIFIPFTTIIPDLIFDEIVYQTTRFIGFISLPITMSIYLARESAKTKADLENQVVQVQELSGKALQQEKREAELRIENAKKELELQKAAELKSAYENLEAAHQKLKSTQVQLIQAEKMASLGELTAGIAHEIQNPLNFVNNFAEVNKELIAELKEEIEKGNLGEAVEIANDIQSNEEKINHHGKRADSIIKGMLQHSRTSSGQKELTDINALADEYLRLAYHGLRAKDKSFNANFKLEAAGNLPKINVIPQEIGRVLLNLINNAFFSVSEKAKQNIEGYKPEVIVRTNYANDKIEIRVIDNGTGIPESVKEKIFQPFFTTKPSGQGTGLGLSMSYDIITKGHGGDLTVETNLNDDLPTGEAATTFIITLPLTQS